MKSQIKLFIELTRLNKPIGIMLLFWPWSWGLAYAYNYTKNLSQFLFYFLLFFFGSVLMKEDNSFQIFVQKPDGETITLDVEASNTIDNIKGMIKGKEGITVKHQRLIFKDTQIEDDWRWCPCIHKKDN